MISPTQPWDPKASPLVPFLSHVIDSIENIAPERRADLAKTAARVRFVIDDEPGFVFRAVGSVDPREVRSSIVGLELLWCLAYAHVTIYQAAPRYGDPTPVQPDPKIQDAAEILQFASTDRASPRPPQFALPIGVPIPEFADQAKLAMATDLHMATEVFVCACAWILHHELGHVDLGHLDTTYASKTDELDADDAATKWILDGAPNEAVLKRGLGIAVALAALSSLALAQPRGYAKRSTYPPTGERVMHAMVHPALGAEHQVHDFAAVALNTHLQQRRIPTSAPASAFDALHEAAMKIMDWELGR